MTGFANSEEDFADKAVGRKSCLFASRMSQETRSTRQHRPCLQPYAVRDGTCSLANNNTAVLSGAVVIEALEGSSHDNRVEAVAMEGLPLLTA